NRAVTGAGGAGRYRHEAAAAGRGERAPGPRGHAGRPRAALGTERGRGLSHAECAIRVRCGRRRSGVAAARGGDQGGRDRHVRNKKATQSVGHWNLNCPVSGQTSWDIIVGEEVLSTTAHITDDLAHSYSRVCTRALS